MLNYGCYVLAVKFLSTIKMPDFESIPKSYECYKEARPYQKFGGGLRLLPPSQNDCHCWFRATRLTEFVETMCNI
jgi:hypothetical protein